MNASRFACAALGLKFAVITSVNRDDRKDGGAELFAMTIRAIRERIQGCGVEVLVPDFQGSHAAMDIVLEAAPDILNHNTETVPRLSRQVRVQASYARSYAILRHAKSRGAIIKTGLMLGLGERLDEVRQVMRELRDIGVDILTLGQYLRPSAAHLEVARFATPEEFAALGAMAKAFGFSTVYAGPLVRSSFNAHEVATTQGISIA